ncbi:MAG: ribonuclease HIII [Erysipelotrichaceae bacterium]|nr:ribonuclease HIII [Erysipelotrichaceae bacterium]
MQTTTLVLTTEQIYQLQTTFKDAIKHPNNPYIQFQIKTDDITITVYTSKKAVFQGENVDIYTSSFTKEKTAYTHAGSDEVGTGDYFGPVCVCAVLITDKIYDEIKALGIMDSKQMSDEVILKLAPILMEKLTYSLLILDNAKYNQVHEFNNMNAIKAKLHNQAYINLSKKTTLPELCVIDQFCEPRSYYRYITNEAQKISTIHFETKAENKYLAVACGSVIARYAFLKTLDKMKEHYDFEFIKGASDLVDACAAKFMKKYGEEALYQVAKVHFKNTEKAKELR